MLATFFFAAEPEADAARLTRTRLRSQLRPAMLCGIPLGGACSCVVGTRREKDCVRIDGDAGVERRTSASAKENYEFEIGEEVEGESEYSDREEEDNALQLFSKAISRAVSGAADGPARPHSRGLGRIQGELRRRVGRDVRHPFGISSGEFEFQSKQPNETKEGSR